MARAQAVLDRFRGRSGGSGLLRVRFVEDSLDHHEMWGHLATAEGIELLEPHLSTPEEAEEAYLGDALLAEVPDVMVVDYDFKPAGSATTGVQLAARLRERYPKLGIVLLTIEPRPQIVEEFLTVTQKGGRGVVWKGHDDVDDFGSFIRMVARGGEIIGPATALRRQAFQEFQKIKPVDLAILDLVAQGFEYQDIGPELRKLGLTTFLLQPGSIRHRVATMANNLGIPSKDAEGRTRDRTMVLIRAFERAQLDR